MSKGISIEVPFYLPYDIPFAFFIFGINKAIAHFMHDIFAIYYRVMFIKLLVAVMGKAYIIFFDPFYLHFFIYFVEP